MSTFDQINTTSSLVLVFTYIYMCVRVCVFKKILNMGNLCSISEVVNAISGIQSLVVKVFLCSPFSLLGANILKMQSLMYLETFNPN